VEFSHFDCRLYLYDFDMKEITRMREDIDELRRRVSFKFSTGVVSTLEVPLSNFHFLVWLIGKKLLFLVNLQANSLQRLWVSLKFVLNIMSDKITSHAASKFQQLLVSPLHYVPGSCYLVRFCLIPFITISF